MHQRKILGMALLSLFVVVSCSHPLATQHVKTRLVASDIGTDIGNRPPREIEDKANLNTLKMTVLDLRDSIKTLASEQNQRLAYYSNLGGLNLIGKNKAKRENCAYIKASLGATLLMLSASLEQSKDALKKLETSDEETSEVETGFNTFTSKSKEAVDGCDSIKKSADAIAEALAGLEKVVATFEKVIPKLW